MHLLLFQHKKSRRKKESKAKPEAEKKKKSRIEFLEEDEGKKTNQFTYVERATQTYNKGTKDRDIQTSPPKKINFCANVNQWIIYDRYTSHEEAKDKADEGDNKLDLKPKRRRFLEKKVENSKEITNRKMIRCAKILERMVNQNNHDEIAIGTCSRILFFSVHLFCCFRLFLL